MQDMPPGKDNSAPAVSVIVPCYNTAQFLGDAIASALGQTCEDLEVLVIDDGSTDSTPEVTASFLKDPRVRYVRQDNQGLSAARNKGIELSRGEFVALLDADDIWEPEKLERQLTVFGNLPECGLVFSDFATFDDRGTIAAQKNQAILERLSLPEFSQLFSRNNFMYPSTVIVRRTVLEQVGGFDTSLKSAEDYDMWLRVARVSQVAGVTAHLVWIRQHGSNMSLNIPRMLNNEIAAVQKNAAGVSAWALRKRLAKIYCLNADRSVHAGKSGQALKLLVQGLVRYPFLYIDVLVVGIKLLLGGHRVESLRRWLNDNDSLVAKLYWSIYSRY
ncbi:glycosyl transferase [Geomonas limicola]|uniref:Glycosyl transferase n=1 Tax=Geomonas limicola TaxID=2740186 RepID=A0A6V8N2I5_9BACT|nr:glycosyl transferase [Geomonas limicola]